MMPSRARRPVRFRAAAFVAALALSVTTACVGGGADGGQESVGGGAGTTAQDSGGGHIWVASGRDVTGKGGIRQQLVDDWNTARKKKEKAGGPVFRAHLVELPGSADQQRSQLLGALQSGSATYDVINLDVTWVPEFAAAGLISPLDDNLLDSDVIDSVARTGRWNGKVYAAPFNSDVGLLFYRRDYLKQVGLNSVELDGKVKTWSDLQAVMNDINEAEKPPPLYEKGWTTQLGRYEGRTVNAIEAFASVDGAPALTDGEGRYTGSTDSLVGGVGELLDRTTQPLILDRAEESDETESLSDFTAGRTAFLRHWPTAYATLHQTFEAEQLGVIPLPGKAVLGGQNLAVSSNSEHAAAARDLVTFLTAAKSQCRLLRAGFAATRKSAYAANPADCRDGTGGDASASPPSASPSGSGESADPMPRDAFGRPEYATGTLLTALRNAAQRPRTPYYGAFTQAFTSALDPLFLDSRPKDKVLAKALDKALREAMPTAD
ncbi:extracellular solute-binding protein [Streptomyces sp. NBC_01498]|uniref:extracellular solute-binding protein n=1 Tax=Streptomyces sp. NBC_01498 TaxID=2975870 RepID=UPI002E7BED90|nr:extracellular solute-binding protein [Streptomyces sp. NBC_01498]WTL24202.1 extracellular solute-binding protein [Streptomyces sp. NBC_01498]